MHLQDIFSSLLLLLLLICIYFTLFYLIDLFIYENMYIGVVFKRKQIQLRL